MKAHMEYCVQFLLSALKHYIIELEKVLKKLAKMLEGLKLYPCVILTKRL